MERGKAVSEWERSAGLLGPPDAPPALPGRRRRWIAVGGAVLAAVVLAGVAVALAHRGGSGGSPSKVTGTDSRPSTPVTWLSGASGDGVTNGAFAAWRGQPLGIAGTWADNNWGMVQLPQLRPGGEFAQWNEPLDIAIGAIGPGETWAAAARGAYDARWRQSLTNLRTLWGSRTSTLYIRFAHEMNGNWYPWSVNASNYQDFVTAWKRFRALQQQIFPASKLVFCLSRESIGNGIDWRRTFPGAEYVDVLGVDYYDNPVERTLHDFRASASATDEHGAPVGIEAYRDFAEKHGLPLAVPEWSGNADSGDYPDFVTGMYQFFRAQAGTGPGRLSYEILFNVTNHTNAQFSLYGTTRLPRSAQRYQQLW